MAWRPRLVLLGFTMLGFLLSSAARAAPPTPYQARAQQLVQMLAKPGGETDFFSSLFLDAVPVDRWRTWSADLRASHGKPLGLGSVRMESDTAGQVEIRYERATIGFTLVVAPHYPAKVVGLHVVGVATHDDSFDKVAADIAALPGTTAFAVAKLSDDRPRILLGANAGKQVAIGSGFKLYILAALARSIAAGERQWSSVIPLSRKSFSGRLRTWPDNAPMTLHSIATAMISESDNSAADTLMVDLGRGSVDAMVMAVGHTDGDRALPLLTTAEAFALKMPVNADLLATWRDASPAKRRDMLQGAHARLTADKVDVGSVADTPVAIDTAEWFASPDDMIRLLQWLRESGEEALPIMAVNPGIAPADARRWRYLGYKGGSEPGVMAMNFLAKSQGGTWYALSMAWNNPAARLDEAKFEALATRTLNLLAKDPR